MLRTMIVDWGLIANGSKSSAKLMLYGVIIVYKKDYFWLFNNQFFITFCYLYSCYYWFIGFRCVSYKYKPEIGLSENRVCVVRDFY